MKRQTLTAALVGAAAALAVPGMSLGATCFAVEGEVKTANTSPTTQLGEIKLDLFDASDNLVFSDIGALVGTITGAGPFGQTILSHTAQFTDGAFVTDGDVAAITGIRKLDEQGMPCSFSIAEAVSDIPGGTGFFANVTSVDIHADGYIALCLEGATIDENENEFELSGEICVAE